MKGRISVTSNYQKNIINVHNTS